MLMEILMVHYSVDWRGKKMATRMELMKGKLKGDMKGVQMAERREHLSDWHLELRSEKNSAHSKVELMGLRSEGWKERSLERKKGDLTVCRLESMLETLKEAS